MDVAFAKAVLKTVCEDPREATRKMGLNSAKKLRSRLADLVAAARFGEVPAGRPNSLKGSRVDQFAIHLSGGHRLAFEANEDPVPTTIDGSIDWKQVTSIRIPFIGDHHD